MLEYYLLIPAIILFIWAINLYITTKKVRRFLNRFFVLAQTDVEKYLLEYYNIMNHFSPFSYKGWFGFRHWFHEYEPLIDEINYNDDYDNFSDFN